MCARAHMCTARKEGTCWIAPRAASADDESFRYYSEGVYDFASCGTKMRDLGHAVVLFGYGSQDGKDYWLVGATHPASFHAYCPGQQCTQMHACRAARMGKLGP